MILIRCGYMLYKYCVQNKNSTSLDPLFLPSPLSPLHCSSTALLLFLTVSFESMKVAPSSKQSGGVLAMKLGWWGHLYAHQRSNILLLSYDLLYNSQVLWCDVMWCDVMWCDVMWCDVMWCDVMWCDVLCYTGLHNMRREIVLNEGY